MDHILPLEQIRSLIRRTFVEFGGAVDQTPREAVLIRDGFYCGQRFEADGLHAIWFSEEHQVKFYDRAGAMVRVVHLDRTDRSPDQGHTADPSGSERAA